MADSIRKTDRHYTFRDYESWPEEERWELIDGIAWNMSPGPSVRHQRVLSQLNDAFKAAAAQAGCETLFAPVDVLLFTPDVSRMRDADTVVQPDLMVVCDPKLLTERGCLGAPDIVVEILSPHTMRKDLTVKRELYQRAGVREYWIVDPGNSAIMIYRLTEDGSYPEDPELFGSGATAISGVLPAVEVRVAFG